MLVARLEGDPIQVTFSFQIPISSTSSPSTLSDVPEEMMEIPNEDVFVDSAALSYQPSSLRFLEVLIVDDAPFNRLVMRKILDTAGFSYAEVSTGLEAVRTMRTACERGSPFSVILMDVEMPEMDGITATRAILQLAANGEVDLPVIIGCSAFSTAEDKADALASGMTHYLEKPISRTHLVEVVDA